MDPVLEDYDVITLIADMDDGTLRVNYYTESGLIIMVIKDMFLWIIEYELSS